MDITLKKVKQDAGSEIYKRGLDYYRQDRVKLNNLTLDRFEAVVEGSATYKISVQHIGENFYSTCTCPYWTTCKHVVAAMLKAKDWYDENRDDMLHVENNPSWQEFFNKIIENEPATGNRKQDQSWKVVYLLDVTQESWSITPQKAYIKRNGFLGRFSNIGEFDVDNSNLIFAPNDPIIVSHIQKQEQQNNSFYNYRYYGGYRYNDLQKYHYRFGSRLGPLFDLLNQSTIYKKPHEDQLAPLQFAGTVDIEFRYQKKKNSLELVPFVLFGDQELRLGSSFRILTEDPIWILHQNSLIKVKNIQSAELLLPFTKSEITLTIPKDEIPQFIEKVYPTMSDTTPLPLPEGVTLKTEASISKKKLYLNESERYLEIDLKFDYGQHEVDYSHPEESLYRQQSNQVCHIIRQRGEEQQVYQDLKKTGLKENSHEGSLRIIDSKALNWLFTNMPKLASQGYEFYGRENLSRYKVRTGSPNVRIAVSSNIDWFDLNIEVDVEGIMLSLKELRKSIRQNVRYVKLVDKSIAQLPEEWFERFRHLFNFTEVSEEQIKVPKFHVTLIDTLFEEAESRQTDETYRESVQKLRTFKGIEPIKLPKNLNGVLRKYQKAGYDWLYFLQSYGFGGCLADDMGLGKTLQTLTMLLREKQNGNKTPSLIVCPTSVVFNWEKEVEKFTPDLKVLIHSGLTRDRHTEEFNNHDIILTSYGIMRRDIAFLKEFRFHYAILDESQKIKNPGSQTAKAARLLNSKYRLVLTGTPVENNTVELWSQFSFLNPGLLGSLNYFKRAFTYAIEKRKDKGAAYFLRQLIYPFILRRTKEGVARELPPKIEQTFYCAMNEEQEKLYAHWRNYYRALILDKIDNAGMDKARMNILEGLVKLRQLACHPYLVDQQVNEDSGKFEALKEFIEEILAEDHKVLVFSQFVKMLRLIRQHLDAEGIPYEYLDGHTTNRKEHVDRFQNDKGVKIFLISLKAGGVGLNLTAADYVIHYDPWWNPAVEVQATDRAHRIGQDKKVFVYRLITKGSVEEKMLDLQAHKRKLVTDLISTDSSFFKSLTRNDVEILFGDGY